MSAMTATPRTLRGAIVAVSPARPLSRVVVFMYNPDQVSRTLQPREQGGAGGAGGGGGGAGSEVRGGVGAPNETVSMTIEIDATDQLAAGDPVAGTVGILPQLSALEMLLHPDSARVMARAVLLAAGSIEVLPVEKPLAVLVFGPARIVPVKITNLQITEQAHSPGLAPLRASAQISASVLSYDDLPVGDVGWGLSLAHLVAKEVLAATGAAAGTISAISDLVR